MNLIEEPKKKKKKPSSPLLKASGGPKVGGQDDPPPTIPRRSTQQAESRIRASPCRALLPSASPGLIAQLARALSSGPTAVSKAPEQPTRPLRPVPSNSS